MIPNWWMFGDDNLEKWTPDARIINALIVSQGVPSRNEKRVIDKSASIKYKTDEPLF